MGRAELEEEKANAAQSLMEASAQILAAEEEVAKANKRAADAEALRDAASNTQQSASQPAAKRAKMEAVQTLEKRFGVPIEEAIHLIAPLAGGDPKAKAEPKG